MMGDVAPTHGWLRAHWRNWLAITLLLGVAYAWTFGWMIDRWQATESYYSHGWLIPPVSAFLIWLRRRTLAQCHVVPRRGGLYLLVAGLLLHITGLTAKTGSLTGFSFLVVLLGLVLALLGTAFLRQLAFPIAFLAFMVPLPHVVIHKISFESKLLAARLSARLLNVLGWSFSQRGSRLRWISNGQIRQVIVDDVCSGLKYTIALMAFGTLYAYLSRLRWQGKVIIVALTIPLALAANVVRVTLMAIAARQWGTEIINNDLFHYGLGIVLFITAFMLFFVAESLMLVFLPRAPGEEVTATERQQDAETSQTLSAVHAAVAAPPRLRYRGVVLAALAVAAALALHLTWPRKSGQDLHLAQRFPTTLGRWHGQDFRLSDHVLKILSAREVMSRFYVAEDTNESLRFLVVTAEHTRRATHPPEICLRAEGYRMEEMTTRFLDLGSSYSRFPVRELVATRGEERLLVQYTFRHAGYYTANYWWYETRITLAKFLRPETSGAIVRVDINLRPGEDLEYARQQAASFLCLALPEVDRVLPAH